MRELLLYNDPLRTVRPFPLLAGETPFTRRKWRFGVIGGLSWDVLNASGSIMHGVQVS